jgi:hypothetical protein
MSLFRYNSSLLALDRSAFNANLSEFKFIPFLQNVELNSNLQKISQKSIGNSNLNKKFYTNPEFSLNISLIQEKNFLLEMLIGLFVNTSSQDNASILNKFQNNFIETAILLLNEKDGEDILYKVRSNGYSEDLLCFVFKKLFLNSYSFSYGDGKLPISNISFSFNDVKISNVLNISNTYYAQEPSGSNIKLENTWIDSFYYKTNFDVSDKINTTAIDFELLTDYSSLEIPSSDLSVLGSSNIQSMDFSLDFKRNNFFFFERGMSPLERAFLFPCLASLSIQGITSQFNEKSLSSLKNSDSKFYIILRFGKSGLGLNYSEIKFENITVESFNYSISMDGFLNYSIQCSVEISDKSGAKFTLLEVSDQDENFIKLHSSDGHKLSSTNGDLVILA